MKCAMLLVLVALVVAGGCDREVSLSAPEVRFGQSTCHECGMILSDDRYAAAVVFARDGERVEYLFDDIGELLAFDDPGAGQGKWYVRDAATRQWVDAPAATYVKAESLETPMGYGVAAFANPADAESLLKKHDGQLLSFAAARGNGEPVAAVSAASRG